MPLVNVNKKFTLNLPGLRSFTFLPGVQEVSDEVYRHGYAKIFLDTVVTSNQITATPEEVEKEAELSEVDDDTQLSEITQETHIEDVTEDVVGEKLDESVKTTDAEAPEQEPVQEAESTATPEQEKASKKK